MMHRIKKALLFAAILLMARFTESCVTPGAGFMGKRSPHKVYADKLANAGLSSSALGKAWFDAAEKSLQRALTVNIPYRENGFFAADAPRAAGIRFAVKRGQKITINVTLKPQNGTRVFADLWEAGADPDLLMAADSTLDMEYEADRDGDIILRLQPELLAAVSYTLTITAGPSLAFPVSGKDGSRVGSVWGDLRDAGVRKHEGIDIFDRFRKPVVAAADGTVTGVGQNNLGGKVVWLRPKGRNYVLYYAHLDSQMVNTWQQVRTGDTLGLIGNTGNARFTPPHLHFGIYTGSGAVNPLPFVERIDTVPEKIKGLIGPVAEGARAAGKQQLQASPEKKSPKIRSLEDHTLLDIQAAMGNYYRVQLPDGMSGFIPVNGISGLSTIRTISLEQEAELYYRPDTAAALVAYIPASGQVSVRASFQDFIYVSYGKAYGWIRRTARSAE